MNQLSISVIIPVYQSAQRLTEHVECLRRLQPMVHEFIWVITESSDGSHEIAREAAKALGGQILDVPRGLYQAWNSGIAQANGEFIYISTVGDTITTEGLNTLSHCIQKTAADVVFSPPVICPATESNRKCTSQWPVFIYEKVLNRFSGVRVPKEKAILLQILSGASGLLGSCASCLFRTSFLQVRPFPTEFHHYGDTAWTYQNLPEAILAFHPDPLAQFKIHDAETPRIVDKNQIYSLIDQLGIHLPLPLPTIVREYNQSRVHVDMIREPKPKLGWWLMPRAWSARWKRNNARRLLIMTVNRF